MKKVFKINMPGDAKLFKEGILLEFCHDFLDILRKYVRVGNYKITVTVERCKRG